MFKFMINPVLSGKTKIILLFTFLLMVDMVLIAQAPEWQWATKAGGILTDEGRSITVDDAGNIYVTGTFGGTATFGSYTFTSSGENDIFIAKMDANGNWLWATQAGGIGDDTGYGITIDEVGNSYVTGYFEDTATFGSYTLYSSGFEDIFVAKIDENGNWLWATKAGGILTDEGISITADDAGNSYVTGTFKDTATFGSYTLYSSGWEDIFVAKIDENGNWLWAAKAGGSSGNSTVISYGITIDNTGNSYVTGIFLDTATFGAYSLTSSGYVNIFVSKMDADGNWLWANQAGGNGWDGGFGIAIDDAGNNYVTGSFKGTVYFGLYPLYSSGFDDIFVAKIDENGNWLWTTQAGGSSSDDSGYGITIDNAGNCYVTGIFMYTATFGSYSLTSNGSKDIFVAKMDENGNWLWVTQAGGIGWDGGFGITINNAGNCYVTGNFRETATFGSHSLTSSGENDIFAAKLNSYVFAENEIIPTEIRLSSFPNPFNPKTTIHFSIEQNQQNEQIELEIYNLKGQKIKTLENLESASPSPFFADGVGYSITWDGTDDNNQPVSSGIYFYKLKAGKYTSTKKMILMK